MSTTSNGFDIIPVPTEAGTHFPGQCKAPQAIIKAGGLQQKLRQHVNGDVNVHGEDEHGILGNEIGALARWRPSEKVGGVRNLDNSLQVMRAAHHYLTSQTQRLDQSFPIILGGDCSITPAVFSAFNHWHENKRLGLLYVDGDADLTLPSQTSTEGSSGILDSMVMTHLTRRDGGLQQMGEFSRPDGSALVTPENVVLFGFDPLQPATEHWVYLVENGFKCFTRPTVQQDPIRSAKKALEYLEEHVDIILLHFDVDVIDSGLFPLANYPHYAGLGFEKALSAINCFLQSEKVRGLVITEVNPNNDLGNHQVQIVGQTSTTMVQQLVNGIVSALSVRFPP